MTKSSIKTFEIDDFIRSNSGFIAFETESKKQNSQQENLPHSHNFYCVSFLYDGEIRHFTDMESHLISAPAILLIGKEQVHIHSNGEDNKMINLCFSEDFVSLHNSNFIANAWDEFFENIFIPLTITEAEEIKTYFKLAFNEFSKKSHLKNNVILCNILSILFSLFKSFQQSKELKRNTGDSIELYYEFKKLIRSDFRRNFNVNFYANKLNVTTDLLNKSIREHTNLSPKQLISNLRLTEAKRLLFWTQKTVKEIAYELGFESDSYFNRFFKKHTGLTPFHFKKINS